MLVINMISEEKPHYIGHRARLKEKFIANPSSIADYELLEILLGFCIPRKDVKELAKKMIQEAGSLPSLLCTPIKKEFGTQTEIFLSLIKELIIRINEDKIKEYERLNDPKEIYKFLKFRIGIDNKESFIVLYLNSALAFISYDIISRGTVNAAPVFIREIAEGALKTRASSVIIAHNHPSGNTSPSEEDKDITLKIKNALSLLDITVSDHIIAGKNSYFSFYENGLMQKLIK